MTPQRQDDPEMMEPSILQRLSSLAGKDAVRRVFDYANAIQADYMGEERKVAVTAMRRTISRDKIYDPLKFIGRLFEAWGNAANRGYGETSTSPDYVSAGGFTRDFNRVADYMRFGFARVCVEQSLPRESFPLEEKERHSLTFANHAFAAFVQHTHPAIYDYAKAMTEMDGNKGAPATHPAP